MKPKYVPDGFYTIKEVMEMTGFSRQTIENYFKAGLLTKYKIIGRSYIKKEELEELLTPKLVEEK